MHGESRLPASLEASLSGGPCDFADIMSWSSRVACVSCRRDFDAAGGASNSVGHAGALVRVGMDKGSQAVQGVRAYLSPKARFSVWLTLLSCVSRAVVRRLANLAFEGASRYVVHVMPDRRSFDVCQVAPSS